MKEGWQEITNTKARAILEVDGKALFEQALPATLFLALEGRLRQVREAYNAIPTLEPGEHWEWDEQRRAYAADPKDSFKTEKVRQNHVKVEATDKHPAQVEVYTKDVVIGRWTTRKWSGAITPAEKADLLERIDTLIQSVKKARQRANACDVEKVSIGKVLCDYIHAPLKKG